MNTFRSKVEERPWVAMVESAFGARRDYSPDDFLDFLGGEHVGSAAAHDGTGVAGGGAGGGLSVDRLGGVRGVAVGAAGLSDLAGNGMDNNGGAIVFGDHADG